MIIRVESKEQFDICLNIIHKSFQTVADELNLTKDNCPSHTAFIPIDKRSLIMMHLCFCISITGALLDIFLCQLMIIALN